MIHSESNRMTYLKTIFLDFVNTICLPLSEDYEMTSTNERYLVAGWGKTEFGSKSDEMLKANIPMKAVEACENAFNITLKTEQIICAGGESLIDSCSGDSGGPLFWTGKMKNSGARYFQFGITAAGYKYCGQLLNGVTPPAFYTKISSYMQWVKSRIH